jgi:hypothetical protein
MWQFQNGMLGQNEEKKTKKQKNNTRSPIFTLFLHQKSHRK